MSSQPSGSWGTQRIEELASRRTGTSTVGHPVPADAILMSNALPFAVSLFAVSSLWGWVWVLRRVVAGQPPLAPVTARAVPWTIVDILVSIYIFLLLQVAAGAVVRVLFNLDPRSGLDRMPLNLRAVLVLTGSIATLATMMASVLLVRWHARATWRDLGIDIKFFARDIGLGVAAFTLLAPPVYGLQMLFVQWFPSEHPVVNLLRERPDPIFLGISAFAAVAVAPVAEEFFFRVLIQGWLHKLHSSSWSLSSWISGRTLLREKGGEPRDDLPPPEGASIGTWPVFASAAVFSLMHAAHGPDPIPLFLLALGLGYLYRQTRRILPCIIVHLLLNVCSLAALMFAIHGAAE
jgi:membrane protease YdiL (CAAX protease family)